MDPVILDSKTLKPIPMLPGQLPSRLPQQDAPPQLPIAQIPGMSASPQLQSLPSPNVSQMVDPAIQSTKLRLLGDQTELKRLGDTGSGVSQIQNTGLRGLARVGDTAASLLLGKMAGYIPGTTQRNLMLQDQAAGRVNNDLANQQEQARTQQADALTDYTLQRPEIEQSKIDQKQTAVHDRVAQAAAARGQKVTWDAEGIPTFEDDHDSQAFADHQALSAMHQATADKSAIMADIAKNHYIPGTPEFTEAQRKLDAVDKRLNVAVASLGLRAQGLQLRQNAQNADFYNQAPDGSTLPGAPQIEDDQGHLTTIGRRNAPTAIKQNAAVGSFKDLNGSVAHAAQTLQGIDLSDPKIVAVMSDPTSTIGKVIGGKLVQGTLSPQEITAVNAVRQLHEQAGILRKVTGGTAAEAQAQRILDTVPVAGDSPAMAASKLQEIQGVIVRLTPAMTRVTGGLTVHGGGKPAANQAQETKTYQGHTYVKGPSGWHLQQ